MSMFSTVWEQVEIPALYSEDKLYEVFKQFTVEINKKLNYPTTYLMTAAEFKAAWRKMNVDDNDREPVVAAKDSAAQTSGESSKAPLAVAVIIVIVGLLVALRKRKK